MKKYTYILSAIVIAIIVLYAYILLDKNNYVTIKINEKKPKSFNVDFSFTYRPRRNTYLDSYLRYPLIPYDRVELNFYLNNLDENIEETKYTFNKSKSSGTIHFQSLDPNIIYLMGSYYLVEGYIMITKRKGDKIWGSYKLTYDVKERMFKDDPKQVQISGKFSDIKIKKITVK